MNDYIFKIVGKKHPICMGNGDVRSPYKYVPPSPIIDREIKKYWNLWRLAPCHKSVVIIKKNKIVAFFRFYIYSDGKFFDGGTWVSRRHRGKGLGMLMWVKALKKYKPKKVEVYAASEAGLLLIKRVRSDFDKIKFRIKK